MGVLQHASYIYIYLKQVEVRHVVMKELCRHVLVNVLTCVISYDSYNNEAWYSNI